MSEVRCTGATTVLPFNSFLPASTWDSSISMACKQKCAFEEINGIRRHAAVRNRGAAFDTALALLELGGIDDPNTVDPVGLVVLRIDELVLLIDSSEASEGNWHDDVPAQKQDVRHQNKCQWEMFFHVVQKLTWISVCDDGSSSKITASGDRVLLIVVIESVGCVITEGIRIEAASSLLNGRAVCSSISTGIIQSHL
ncbi:hypothetical protein J5N97_019615 [Dioscorea zingiberensis]|uniref:Uncharacterized protein n=1 Tax=Dioscorea zingiberensis TaxID=325984 RepID=A0A9D5HCG6_9LILI|nr:hypothetical protein J5N97_019615 [Dioscorea zingiberensis]